MVINSQQAQSIREAVDKYIFDVTHVEHEGRYASKIILCNYLQHLDVPCIKKADSALGDLMLTNADDVLKIFKQLLEEESLTESHQVGIRVAFSDMIPQMKVGDISAHHVGHLISLKGALNSFKEQRVETIYTAECECCHKPLKSPKPIVRCYFCKTLLSDPNNKSMKTYQDLGFMEINENSTVSRQINLYFEKHPVLEYNVINPYELLYNTIEVLGYVTYNNEIKKFELCLLNARNIDEMCLTPERKEVVRKFIEENREHIPSILRNHICPHIFGAEEQIMLTLMTIIGCDGLPDTQLMNRISQLMIIVIGKYGRGKSAISKAFLKYLPNSAAINVLTSSDAGMKAGISKDEKGNFQMILGTLPRCHNSFCILEELDKDAEQSNNYLFPISEAKIRLDKIIQFEKPIHINFITNANPIHGDFESTSTFFSQINLPTPFLSRADCIIIPPAAFDNKSEDEFFGRLFGEQKVEKDYDDALIRDIMVYLKKYTRNPIILPDGLDVIKNYWRDIRDYGKQDDEKDKNFDNEIRSAISAIKYSKAYGRLFLWETMGAEQVRAAIRYLIWAYKTLTKNPSGFLLLMESSSHAKIPVTAKERIYFILSKVKSFPEGISGDDLFNACRDLNVPSVTINNFIEELVKSAQLMRTYQQGKALFKIGVYEGNISTEYIDKKPCIEWLLEKLETKETLYDTEIYLSKDYSEPEITEALTKLKFQGDITENPAGTFKRL